MAQAGGIDSGDSGSPANIARRVLAHFQKNAQAMDSVEGIARFWVHEDTSVVARCLADLHARGLLSRRTIAGTEFYSLAGDGDVPPSAPVFAAGPGSAPAAAAPAAIVAASPGSSPAAARQAPNGAAATPAAAPAAEARGRILVVDDDKAVRGMLARALAEAGHRVTEAADGAGAVALFRESAFDVVVTDVRMPKMSGLDLLQSVKQASLATEVIVITAHATLDTAVAALRHGAYDLLTKPLPDIETLNRAVERALEKRRLSMENRLLVGNLQARNVELRETVARLAAVHEIGKATTGLLDLAELYDALVRLVAQHLKARRVSVLISDPDSITMTLVGSIGIPQHEAQRARVRVGEGIAGKVAETQSPLLVQDIERSDLRGLRTGGKYATASFMITPLMVSYPIRYQRRRVGVINVSDKHSGDPFNDQDLEFLSTLASQVAVAIENARLVKEMEDGYLGALVAVIQGVEDAAPGTRGHSRRVADLAAAIARVMDLQEARVGTLARAAMLHEIGRLAQPGRNGNGGGPSGGNGDHGAGESKNASGAAGAGAAGAPGGWDATAVMAAERILAPISSLRQVRETILHSTDAYEAAGPFASEGAGVPVEARILAACEEFVRRTPGDGHDAAAIATALEALRAGAGRRHDPEVVAALGFVVTGGRR